MGEMIYDVVSDSIRPLLNPALTASWEKGLTMVADGASHRMITWESLRISWEGEPLPCGD